MTSSLHITSGTSSNLIPLFFLLYHTYYDNNGSHRHTWWVFFSWYYRSSNVPLVPLSLPFSLWQFDGSQKLHIFLFECSCSVVFFSICTSPHASIYISYLKSAVVCFRLFPLPLVSQWSVRDKPQTELFHSVCSYRFNCRCCFSKGWMSRLDEHGKVKVFFKYSLNKSYYI